MDLVIDLALDIELAYINECVTEDISLLQPSRLDIGILARDLKQDVSLLFEVDTGFNLWDVVTHLKLYSSESHYPYLLGLHFHLIDLDHFGLRLPLTRVT